MLKSKNPSTSYLKNSMNSQYNKSEGNSSRLNNHSKLSHKRNRTLKKIRRNLKCNPTEIQVHSFLLMKDISKIKEKLLKIWLNRTKAHKSSQKWSILIKSWWNSLKLNDFPYKNLHLYSMMLWSESRVEKAPLLERSLTKYL